MRRFVFLFSTLNKTVISLRLDGYEMVMDNSALRARSSHFTNRLSLNKCSFDVNVKFVLIISALNLSATVLNRGRQERPIH